MVTCSPVVDGGRWQEGLAEGELQQPRKLSSAYASAYALSSSVSFRTLVYDSETGSLRYPKPSGRAGNLQPRSPKSPRSPASSFKLELENDEQLGAVVGDSHCSTPLSKKFLGESFLESGESSPTCVIQNSALRSNSSSPTMSTISKASSDASRRSQGRETEGASFTGAKLLNVATRSPPEVDEETMSSGPKSPRLESLKIGEVRERIKKLESINSTSGKPVGKGPVLRRTENDSKENAGWSHPHDPTQNPQFKSIQCAMAMEAGLKKTKHGGIPASVSRLADSSIMHCHKSHGIFSFNATYMSRAPDADLDFDFGNDPIHGHAIAGVPSTIAKVGVLQQQQQQQQLDLSRRNFLAPLLKPTPSKWDDAEKWLPGSECQTAKAKSRSGPLLAQMVAAQAGMSIPWKGPQIVPSSQSERHNYTAGVAFGQRGQDASEVDSNGSEAADVKDIQTQASTPSPPSLTPSLPSNLPGLVDFTADEKEQLNLLLDRYAMESMKSGELQLSSDGSTSPSRSKGSFLKLGARMDKPASEGDFGAPATEDCNSQNTIDLDSKPNFTLVITRDMGTDMTPEGDSMTSTPSTPDSDPKPHVTRITTRDMGTAMTPIPSVEPSRNSTPLKRPSEAAAATRSTIAKEMCPTTMESPMTEKEFQEKTRQEIVVLGTQLGKANIAAAWAARELLDLQQQQQQQQELSSTVRLRSNGSLDLETLRRDVFASRAEAWQEAEKMKYTSRFEQEKAKILVWEEQEKVKAEAEMRRVELKAERMKSQAHEKLNHKLTTTQRQVEEFRLVAEARQAVAAAKAAKKADILKTNGKVTNLLFLSFFCT